MERRQQPRLHAGQRAELCKHSDGQRLRELSEGDHCDELRGGHADAWIFRGEIMRSILNRFSAHFNNDWRQIFQVGQCNWYSFHVAYVYFEIDEMAKAYEFTCILVGLGFTVRYDRDFEHSEIQRRADEVWEEINAG